MTRAVLLVELGLGVAAGLVFIWLHGRGPWRHTPAGRQLMLAAVACTGELATLFAIGAGMRVPMWLLLAGYGLVDVVMIRWAVLKWQARRLERENIHG